MIPAPKDHQAWLAEDWAWLGHDAGNHGYGGYSDNSDALYGNYVRSGTSKNWEIADNQDSVYGGISANGGSGWGCSSANGEHTEVGGGAGHGIYGDLIEHVKSHGEGTGWGDDFEVGTAFGHVRYNRSCGAQEAGIPVCEIDLEELADFTLSRYAVYYHDWDHYYPPYRRKPHSK